MAFCSFCLLPWEKDVSLFIYVVKKRNTDLFPAIRQHDVVLALSAFLLPLLVVAEIGSFLVIIHHVAEIVVSWLLSRYRSGVSKK